MNTEEINKIKQNPRINFIQAIQNNRADVCLLKTSEVHGHFCPGSALGVMASLCGLQHPEINYISSEGFEDLVAIVEINACFADGIQVVTGCTLGNNSLIYRDSGKHAVTFVLRGKEKGVRVRVRPEFQNIIKDIEPEFYPLLEKVIIKKDYTTEDEIRFKEKARDAAFGIIELNFDKILILDIVKPGLPEYAPITRSAICSTCKEQVMCTKTITTDDDSVLCYLCASKEYYQVEGKGITKSDNCLLL